MNGQEVFRIDKDVQLFYIGKNDVVSAPTSPSFLRAVIVDQHAGIADGQVPAFLESGDWTYPMIPNQSPVYKSSSGAYTFPDLREDENAAYIGITLPSDISTETRAQLDSTLLQLAGITEFPVVPRTEDLDNVTATSPIAAVVPTPATVEPDGMPVSTMVAASFMSGAEKLAHGIVYSAGKADELISYGAGFIVSKLSPAEGEVDFPPDLIRGLNTVARVTGKAVEISEYLVRELRNGTVKLGKWIMPYLRRASHKLYSTVTSTSEAEASRNMDQILQFAGGAAVGFGTVYAGLDHAARVLGNSITNNTVQIVNKRFGSRAGAVVGSTVDSIGNALSAKNTMKSFIPKVVANSVGHSSVESFMHEVPPQQGTSQSR